MATHSSILAQRIPMNSGAWQATVHGVAESRTPLSDEVQRSTNLTQVRWLSVVMSLVSLQILVCVCTQVRRLSVVISRVSLQILVCVCVCVCVCVHR